MTDTLFINVDTQYDFVREDGKLPVPGAEDIEDELGYLTETARDADITVLNTADWHNEQTDEISDDPDYQKTFPEHCMQGTTGAAYVPATQPDDPYEIDWQDDGFDHQAVREADELVVYKDEFNVFEGNPHTDQILDELDPDEAVVYGVATDVCVDFAVSGLLERGIDVYVVEDAIAGLGDEEELEEVKQDWTERGAELVTADGVLER